VTYRDAFNDRDGIISYHAVSSSIADVPAVADRYCRGIGRKAKLGSATMGLTAMNVPFEGVR
jgi:hypothetical protein